MTALPEEIYFQVFVWQDDTQANLITTASAVPAPVTDVSYAQLKEQISAPGQYHLTLRLTDPLAQPIAEGNYVEVYRNFTTTGGVYPPPAPAKEWWAGYVQDVKKVGDQNDAFDIDCADPSIYLADYRTTDALEMPYPQYNGIIDFLNGVGPGNGNLGLGILPPGCTAVWMDPDGNPPAGQGDSIFSANDSALADLNKLCQDYGLYWRRRQGSKRSNLVIEVGPFGGTSNVTAWGGQPLIDEINAIFNSHLTDVNAALAQENGYSFVAGAEFDENRQKIINAAFGFGHGTNATLVTLRSIFGDIFNADGSLASGVEIWSPPENPSDDSYYVRRNSATNWNGNTYDLFARQNQDKTWEYGAIDVTSADTYGLSQTDVSDKKALDPHVILSKCLGAIDYGSKPLYSWTIPVLHPLDGDGPPTVQVGQTIDIQYTGRISHGLEIDIDPDSETYGQQIAGDAVDYLTFPGTTDPALIKKLQKCVQIEETYDSRGYLCTYTLGRAKVDGAHYAWKLEQRLMDTLHAPHQPHAFVADTHFHGLSFLRSIKPTVWPQRANRWLLFEPGSMGVFDAPDDRFFGDGHHIGFDVTLDGWKQYFDVLIAKPYDSTLQSLYTYPKKYLIFRLALKDSGQQTGLYVTDGDTYTHVGGEPHKKVFPFAPNPFHVQVQYSDFEWRVYVSHPHLGHVAGGQTGDVPGKRVLVAVWHDLAGTISTYGSLGWYLKAGTHENAYLSNLYVAPYRHTGAAQGGNGGGGHSMVLV